MWLAGLCCRNCGHSGDAIGAGPSGRPGWPLAAFCTMATERKRGVSMQRWSREAGSWVDDIGVLRIDVDAHANRSLAALARSPWFVIPAKAGTRRLWFFNVSKSLVHRFRGADGTF